MTVLERVDLDAVNRQAREVRFWHTVGTVLVTILFGMGWLTARIFSLTWFAVAWMGVAFREGWRAGRATSGVNRGPAGTG